ncbi:Nif11-like leader peptide family natural product precursor [Amphritea pacifica]|uniref:Nif11-like leader peptide family natural product precursor n=1 Tax=Amphritea pacifica TaxID=2811233 RepID=UPI0019657B9B|nr:Nif11-like leader peptide family natural product precursor [Amphritea pacifica]MBN1005734.1 Nif11-like leader peptide family natural product precursor [Amphritea pacifica]
MLTHQIAAFSSKARQTPELSRKLKNCHRLTDMLALAQDLGFFFEEDSLYPPNKPQFTEDQLSDRLVKVLLRFYA